VVVENQPDLRRIQIKIGGGKGVNQYDLFMVIIINCNQQGKMHTDGMVEDQKCKTVGFCSTLKIITGLTMGMF